MLSARYIATDSHSFHLISSIASHLIHLRTRLPYSQIPLYANTLARMSRPNLKPFTPLAAANLAAVPVQRITPSARSYSFSSTSSSSSAYSRAPEDLVDRLAAHNVSLTLI